MAISFDGSFTVPRSPREVFDFLTDPHRFGPLLPDFQSMTVEDPTHFTVKVSVGISHIRGTAEVKMAREQAVAPSKAVYSGLGSMAGSSVQIRAGFDLTPESNGTRVTWQGEAQIFGRLASMAGGLLEPLGRKNMQKLIAALEQALSKPSGAEVAQ